MSVEGGVGAFLATEKYLFYLKGCKMKEYQKLIQEALLGVVRKILQKTATEGLSDPHHYYITFQTTADGVQIPIFLKERFPYEMTIVLQYQFDELTVEEDFFSVLLSFNGKPEKLIVPFKSILSFADPSQEFMLQFMPALMNEKKNKQTEQNKPAEVIDLAAMRNKK